MNCYCYCWIKKLMNSNSMMIPMNWMSWRIDCCSNSSLTEKTKNSNLIPMNCCSNSIPKTNYLMKTMTGLSWNSNLTKKRNY